MFLTQRVIFLTLDRPRHKQGDRGLIPMLFALYARPTHSSAACSPGLNCIARSSQRRASG